MTEFRRLLALAAVMNLIVGIGVADAQTVMVRHAPPDSEIEVVLNTTRVGSTKANASGDASIPVNLSTTVNKTETDAQIFVDVCSTIRRVLIAERGVQPPAAEAGCVRRDMGGWFLVRRVSTLVVDVGGPTPTLLLRQGGVSFDSPMSMDTPTGLVVFGGGAFTKYRDAGVFACGDVSDCSKDDTGFGFTGGVAFWLTPYLAAEGTYLRPPDATASGTGSTYRFETSLDVHVVMVAGQVGIPLGRFRPYGQIGATYTWATLETRQTMTNVTENATQAYLLKTEGWGWTFGGGVEGWVTPSVAIYGEGGLADLKGEAADGREGTLDDRLTYIFVGARVRIGW